MEVSPRYIERCLDLASNGLGMVAPNPMVGCVIIHDNNIVGEGYHAIFGGPHAEVVAINSLQDKALLKQATLYVNLEPCNHQGKTPPCTELILQTGIKNVVVGSVDPNPVVSGKGIERLRQNGCNVTVGIMEHECKDLNKRFFKFQSEKRPYVILKWAQSADGFIDYARPLTSRPAMITSEKLRVLVHKWRSEEQAIMVGTNTAIDDNPRLDVRDWTGKQPIRLVIDRELKIPETNNLLNNQLDTWIINEKIEKVTGKTSWVKFPFDENILDLEFFIDFVGSKQIQSIFVEGGEKLLQAFINKGLWDEARVFCGNQLFKSGTKAPIIEKAPTSKHNFSGEKLFIFDNHQTT